MEQRGLKAVLTWAASLAGGRLTHRVTKLALELRFLYGEGVPMTPLQGYRHLSILLWMAIKVLGGERLA